MSEGVECTSIGPDWVSLVGRLLGSTKLLEFYGAPALLNQLGVFQLTISGFEGFIWDFSGLYEVKVNNGGYITETPLEPSRFIDVNVRVVDLRDIVGGLLEITGSSGSPGFFNVLGWRPLAPIITNANLGLPGCLDFGSGSVNVLNLEPLHGGIASYCSRLRKSEVNVEVKLGVFKLNVRGDVGKLGLLTVVHEGDTVVSMTPGSITMKSPSLTEVTITHPYRDYSISLMHILSFYRFKGEGVFRGVSAVIEGSRGSLAIASPSGFELEASRGVVTLRFKGELSATTGGYVEASRLLMERSIKWSLTEIPGEPLGHVRSYRVSPVLVGFRDNRLLFIASNPTMADGGFEIKLYQPVANARFKTIDGWVEMRILRDIVTIPVPRGYCGVIEIGVTKPPIGSLLEAQH